LIKLSNPIRFGKLTNVMQIRGVDTYVHWSVFAVAAFILAGVVRQPGRTLLGLVLYLAVLLIHESGHLIAAPRKGCRVQSIQLYPIFGITRFETPWSRLDHCIIAWGGVLAQAVVFIPLVAWVAVFGYLQAVGIAMIFAILGFFSLGVAVFNLVPVPPLDGSIAWGIVPALLGERRSRISRKPTYR
jgi:membrane-associated protease RseP (regulator of RpoE activity)